MTTGIAIGAVVLIAVFWFASQKLGVQSTVHLDATDRLVVERVPTDRDLELAALQHLSPLPFASAMFPRTDAELDQYQRWIREKRQWAEGLTDARVRRAYTGWIEYVQRRVNENRRENQTHAERDAFESRQKARRDEWQRGADAARTIPAPPQ